MNRFYVFMMFFLALVFLGCSSVPSVNKYAKAGDFPVYYEVTIRDIAVEDNYVKSKDLENQIKYNLETLNLKSRQNFQNNKKIKDLENEKAYLDVAISQRTFIKNIEPYNSIFVNFRLSDSSGNTILQNCFNKTSKENIVSSYEHNKICRFIFREINGFVLKRSNNKSNKR